MPYHGLYLDFLNVPRYEKLFVVWSFQEDQVQTMISL